jgi:hypothetical protein
VAIMTVSLLIGDVSPSFSKKTRDSQASAPSGQVRIKRIVPEKGGGQGYELEYYVDVPIATYWKFKIDFDNIFLTGNKYILDHRFISQDGDIAITENKYTHGPDVYFRWQTTISQERFRLDFILLNPEQCRQAYHYGFIKLTPVGAGTRVTQIAYFDFWGASFWVHYPWKGGMKDFLTYTARWEQTTARRSMRPAESKG